MLRGRRNGVVWPIAGHRASAGRGLRGHDGVVLEQGRGWGARGPCQGVWKQRSLGLTGPAEAQLGRPMHHSRTLARATGPVRKHRPAADCMIRERSLWPMGPAEAQPGRPMHHSRTLARACRPPDTEGGWCERRDSNPHALRHWNLNPGRLPIPPLSLKAGDRASARRHSRPRHRENRNRPRNDRPEKKKAPGGTRCFSGIGGPSRIRTLDLLIKSQLLYQLS